MEMESTEEDFQCALVNPLLLNTVLNQLFSTLDLKQLLICRLVCKAWCDNDRLIALIRKKTIVNLQTVFLHTATTTENIEHYFQSGPIIYSHYNFENISYHNPFISKFFDTIGNSIKSLRLHLNLEQLNIDQFRELIYEKLPNLNELSIFNLSHEEVYMKPLFSPPESDLISEAAIHKKLTILNLDEIRTYNTEFMHCFLNSLPNLREIYFHSEITTDWPDQADMWRENSAIATSVISGLKSSGAFKSLKIFKCGKLRMEHIQSLFEMGEEGLQLETFEFHVPRKDCEDIFMQFMNTQRGSLKELIIFEAGISRYKRAIDECFILELHHRMPKLELIQLSKRYKSVIIPLAPTNLALQCPSLKQLIFIGQRPIEGYQSLYDGSNTQVKEITLWCRVRHEETASILGTFCNLTKLSMRYPSREFLKAFWTTCGQIKELELIVEEGRFMDDAVTGISENKISQWLLYDSESQAVAECPIKFRKRNRHSILNLKDLQNLKIIVEHNEKSTRQAVSDFTAYFALIKCAKLRNLELYSEDWQEGLTECQFLSGRWKEFLRQELNMTIIHFNPVQQLKF